MHGLSSLQQGDHVCAVYETPDEQLGTIVNYMKAGLDAGERCLYIIDDRSADEVLSAFEDGGIDVGAARGSNRLVVLTKRESYLKNGTFDPDQMVYSLSAMTDQALAESCTGLRITGEMTWALGTETGCDRVIQYEAKLNEFFPDSRAQAICQYNRSRFSPAVIREVLRTHPLAVMGNRLYDNPFFEPPEVIGLPEAHPRRLQHMLDQIKATARGRARYPAAARSSAAAARRSE